MHPTLPLSKASTGDRFQVTEMEIGGELRRRLLDLGFVAGAVVEVLHKSPLGDPVAYRINNTTIALRKDESSRIFGCVRGGDEDE